MAENIERPTASKAKVATVAAGAPAGVQSYKKHQGKNYRVDLHPGQSNRSPVNVIDTTATSSKAARNGRTGGGDWIFRLDRPHHGANFDHVNINPAISGIPDRHLPLPRGALTAGKHIAKASKVVGRVALPAAIVMDGISATVAIAEDTSYGTSRNTVETAAGIAGGWGGGLGGAVGGAALGTAIFPGVGTIVGGIVGGIAGGIGGSLGAGAAAEAIGDACDYDIVEKKCKRCGRKFKIRQYQGENYSLCKNCRG